MIYSNLQVRSFEFSDFIYQCGWYLLFCFFWTGQFILALGEIVFAMTIAKWYFSRDKSTVGSFTVIASINASMLYHSGTAAFGSLIIAIIKMIRAVIAYFQRKGKLCRFISKYYFSLSAFSYHFIYSLQKLRRWTPVSQKLFYVASSAVFGAWRNV